jgi:2-keto-4-pentenoate hydratase/2-oxohepta-3-ene-1,7-dioic acid hydratase in catechol pathway
MKIFSCLLKGKPIIGIRILEKSFNLSKILQSHIAPKLPDAVAADLKCLLENGILTRTVFAKLDKLFKADKLSKYAVSEKSVKYLPPVKNPSKIIALGRNYAAHAKEGGLPVPDEPIIFDKLVSSLIGHKENIVIPRWVKTRIDHEVELAVVIGKKAKYVTAEKAYDYVFGYTIVNDISARDMQTDDLEKSLPWMRSKSFDTFTPAGPYVVPKQFITDPHKLVISLSVNKEVRQNSMTSYLIFSLPQVIEFITKHFTLLPGDIISTGTPEGISSIKEGDLVEATVGGIGTLTNPVVREK